MTYWLPVVLIGFVAGILMACTGTSRKQNSILFGLMAVLLLLTMRLRPFVEEARFFDFLIYFLCWGIPFVLGISLTMTAKYRLPDLIDRYRSYPRIH